VRSVCFSRDGKQVFAWNASGQVLAWDSVTGHRADASNPPPRPDFNPARSPDGDLEARVTGRTVELMDSRLIESKANHWPLPDRAERLSYHGEQAALAEKQRQHFAAAFHLGRMLLDDPDNAGLKRRLDEAVKKDAAASITEGK
jgi:hypothetical protein